jgi:hypothetical protein
MQLTCDVFDCGFTTSRESYLSVHQRVHNGALFLGALFLSAEPFLQNAAHLLRTNASTQVNGLLCAANLDARTLQQQKPFLMHTLSGTGAYCRISVWLTAAATRQHQGLV